MTDLKRRALARLPMTEAEVEAAYCRGVDPLPECEYHPGMRVTCPVTPEVANEQ